MKNLLFILLVAISVASCGSSEKKAKHPANTVDEFMTEYYSEYGGYMPITMHLRHTLNDPSSLEIADCYKCIKNESGNFICVCDFRAKNKFGALVLSRATAEITPAGDIVTIDIK